MMNDNLGEITIYNPSMAKKAAEMFNAFNELWPGGFGGGVPYTEDRVHDWLDKTSALADLIAVDSDGELAGYCGLYPHWRDKNAAYISILGVIPKVKGKKFGKRLLLKALEIAKENGITRVDLHTWSGNLEAVPLYKKIGLFWVPDTSVYMQDFIPGLLQIPLAKEWFNKHPDWYGNFKRELAQSQDKEIIDNMEIFKYHFEEDNDSLTAEVDCFGWDFCGFERVLENKKINLKSRVKSHEIFIGIPNSLTLIISTDYDDEEATLDVKGFDGLKWLEEFPKKINLKKGETQTITREFIVDKTTKTFKSNDRSNVKIVSKIEIGKNKYELFTSGKIQPAVKLRGVTDNRFKTLPVGKDVTISFDIINNTKEKLNGKLEVLIDGIDNYKQIIDFKLGAEEISGIELPVNLPLNVECKKYKVQATSIIDYNNSEQEMPVFDYFVLPKSNRLMEILEVEETKQLFLATDKVFARVNLEGGTIVIQNGEHGNTVPIAHSSGPPYGISLDSTTLQSYQVERNGREITLILSSNSLQVPGLNVKKYLRTALGANEIEYWVKYSNIQKEGSIHASARTRTASGGISINPFNAKGRSFTPIAGKIIENDTLTNFMTDPLVPTDPKMWQETWTAAEGLYANDLSAWIWKPDNVEKIKLRTGSLQNLESVTKELKPNESFTPIHLWHSFGMNSLQEVRERWNQLIGNVQFNFEEATAGPKTIEALNIKLTGENIIPIGETIKTSLEIFISSPYPLPGQLTFKLPKNWEGYFITENGKETSIQMPELIPFENTKIDIELTAPDKKVSPVENICVHFSGEFDIDFNNYILVITKDEIQVNEKKDDNEESIEIINNALSFEVAKSLTGNLIRLKDNKGKTFLADNYPKVQPKFFFEHYLGGLQPILFHRIADDPFNKLEKCKTVPIEEGLWKGLVSTWTIKEDKEYLKGQKVELKYLTLPGSEIVKIVLTQINNTSREIPTIVGLMADIALDGSTEKNVIEAIGATRTWYRNPWKTPLVSQGSFDKPYSRVTKGKQSIAFIIPKGTNGSAVSGDFGVMMFAWTLVSLNIKPNSRSSAECIILLNQPAEKMEELRNALAK